MCGIVGYIGPKKVVPVVIEGLRKLEYRGYDSAGIAVVNGTGKLEIRRAPGKLRNLEEVIQKSPLEGTYGIGHTRWPRTDVYRGKCPPAPRLHWRNRGGAQRHHRKLPRAKRTTATRRTQICYPRRTPKSSPISLRRIRRAEFHWKKRCAAR